MAFIDEHKERFEKAIEHLRSEIMALRTGRATPALVEDIFVDAYGTKQNIKAVATITIADAKTITIDPWDKGLIQAVETAITQSSLGINPVNDGKVLRLPLPDLTTERRQELIKVLHTKLEEARIAVRKTREDIRSDIDRQVKENTISEDEKFMYQDEVEEIVQEYNQRIKEIGEVKEKDITTV